MLARFHGDPFSSRLACGQHRVFSVKLLITPASFAHIETSGTDAISFLQLLRKGGKDSLYLVVKHIKVEEGDARNAHPTHPLPISVHHELGMGRFQRLPPSDSTCRASCPA